MRSDAALLITESKEKGWVTVWLLKICNKGRHWANDNGWKLTAITVVFTGSYRTGNESYFQLISPQRHSSDFICTSRIHENCFCRQQYLIDPVLVLKAVQHKIIKWIVCLILRARANQSSTAAQQGKVWRFCESSYSWIFRGVNSTHFYSVEVIEG